MECPQSWPVVLSILASCHLPGLPIRHPLCLNAGAFFLFVLTTLDRLGASATEQEFCHPPLRHPLARLLGRTGASATEQEIKALSGAGALSSYAIVHFATHGLVAGETERFARTLAEPALLLTPPDIASSEDDGLLTASEVAELRLDADWVVLSACNTAAAGKTDNAEALSGLARAFFYAGSRALLVSHWYVDSHAAGKLTTGTFAAMREEPQLGRAEALRRAMPSAMADDTRPANWTPSAHPAVWAPFVIVGEGGRRP